MTPTDIYRDGALDTMRRLVNHLTLATDLDEWRPLFMASLEAFETGEAPAPPELADTDWQMVPLPFAPDHGDGTVVIQHSSSETIGTVSSGWAPEADGETDEEPLAVTQTEHGWEGTLDDTPRHSEDPSPAEELAQTAATVEIPDAEPAGQLAFGGLPLSQAIERVLTASVDACGTSVAGLRGKGQARPEVNARTVAAVLLCELLSLDTATISKHVNRSEPSVANYLLCKRSGTRDEVAALLEEARTAVLSA